MELITEPRKQRLHDLEREIESNLEREIEANRSREVGVDLEREIEGSLPLDRQFSSQSPSGAPTRPTSSIPDSTRGHAGSGGAGSGGAGFGGAGCGVGTASREEHPRDADPEPDPYVEQHPHAGPDLEGPDMVAADVEAADVARADVEAADPAVDPAAGDPEARMNLCLQPLLLGDAEVVEAMRRIEGRVEQDFSWPRVLADRFGGHAKMTGVVLADAWKDLVEETEDAPLEGWLQRRREEQQRLKAVRSVTAPGPQPPLLLPLTLQPRFQWR